MTNITADKYRLLVESVHDFAIFVTDPQGIIQSWNQGIGRILGYSENEWVGQHTRIIFTPEDLARRECESELARAAANGRAEDIRWHVRKDGGRFWADGVMTPLYDEMGNLVGFGKVMRDATQRKQAETALIDAENRLAAVIDSAMDAILTAGEDQRILSCNPAALAMFGYRAEEVEGQPLEMLMPERFRPRHGGHVERFGLSGETRPSRESFGVLTARRRDGTEFPIEASVSRFQDADGRTLFAAFVRDISERFAAEISLRQSEQRFRALVDASSQIVWTNAPTGLMEGDQPGWAAFTGQSREEYQGFGWADAVHPEDREGTVEEWNRCVRERTTFVWEHRLRRHDRVYRTFSIRGVPVLGDDGTIREWVGIHTDITEQRQNEAALRDALDWESARAEREALIRRIGDGIRQSLPPEEIELHAVSALGRALAADRCYVFTADPARDTLVVAQEWHAPGVPPLVGQYSLSELGIDLDKAFGAGITLVAPHLQGDDERLSDKNADANRQFAVSSLVNAPFFEGKRFVGALAVAMAQGAREWTPSEVALVETVAGQLRSTLEAARLQQRERTIATQLQDALQPPDPHDLPGLALKGFYRPALEEAGVGGDFFDVFPVGDGCTALVVGDLSGKGLSAASEVATVRNMVRYALYAENPGEDREGVIGDAITGLDRIFVSNGLLSGFATLFVGLFAHDARTLQYVNCGQEPGLLWRAADQTVEEMGPTGPVLGGFESAGGYAEGRVQLLPGDVLALFTDGMTEVGPDRREFLEVEGVSRLLRECAGRGHGPQTIVSHLIRGVDAFGQGGAGDDIALLVGVVTETPGTLAAAGGIRDQESDGKRV